MLIVFLCSHSYLTALHKRFIIFLSSYLLIFNAYLTIDYISKEY
jgi:hypothetical protein